MHYVVCIKQVPEGTEVAIDEEKGVLKREGVESKLNIYDTHALEAAVELKERYGGTVTVLSMGPPQAESIIREAYALGADQGYLLSDRAFAGADTLATSYTLSEAIRRLPQADLILCGMQTTDGDTAQVGPGIAELLELPHVSYVSRINRISNGAVEVEADMGDGIELLKVGLPCLLTVTKAVNQPPSVVPTQKGEAAAGSQHLDQSGSSGSQSCVLRAFWFTHASGAHLRPNQGW